MKRVVVSSSQIAAVGYDDASAILEVEFKPNRLGVSAVWQYGPVRREIFEAMVDPQQSTGQIFAQHVKLEIGISARHIADEERSEEEQRLKAAFGL